MPNTPDMARKTIVRHNPKFAEELSKKANEFNVDLSKKQKEFGINKEQVIDKLIEKNRVQSCKENLDQIVDEMTPKQKQYAKEVSRDIKNTRETLVNNVNRIVDNVMESHKDTDISAIPVDPTEFRGVTSGPFPIINPEKYGYPIESPKQTGEYKEIPGTTTGIIDARTGMEGHHISKEKGAMEKVWDTMRDTAMSLKDKVVEGMQSLTVSANETADNINRKLDEIDNQYGVTETAQKVEKDLTEATRPAIDEIKKTADTISSKTKEEADKMLPHDVPKQSQVPTTTTTTTARR